MMFSNIQSVLFPDVCEHEQEQEQEQNEIQQMQTDMKEMKEMMKNQSIFIDHLVKHQLDQDVIIDNLKKQNSHLEETLSTTYNLLNNNILNVTNTMYNMLGAQNNGCNLEMNPTFENFKNVMNAELKKKCNKDEMKDVKEKLNACCSLQNEVLEINEKHKNLMNVINVMNTELKKKCNKDDVQDFKEKLNDIQDVQDICNVLQDVVLEMNEKYKNMQGVVNTLENNVDVIDSVLCHIEKTNVFGNVFAFSGGGGFRYIALRNTLLTNVSMTEIRNYFQHKYKIDKEDMRLNFLTPFNPGYTLGCPVKKLITQKKSMKMINWCMNYFVKLMMKEEMKMPT